MKCGRQTMRLYAVTDRAWTGRQTLAGQVKEALEGGITCLQLREKDLDPEAFLQEAREIGQLCRAYGVPFIINDDVDIALACDADGIHVGQEDMDAGRIRQRVGDDMILGVSVHSVQEAQAAIESGADYLGLGAVFATSTKEDAQPMSRAQLQAICEAASIPVVAIGGISEANIGQLAGSGVDGVALVSAIFGAEDIRKTCRRLKKLSEDMVNA